MTFLLPFFPLIPVRRMQPLENVLVRYFIQKQVVMLVVPIDSWY